jgi:hypothetical protein
MYKRLVPLDQARHARLGIAPISDYGFARATLSVPVVMDEIADVAREYPIVFPTQGGLPVALMGVEAGSNAYVGPDGDWRATYVPASLRAYPFAAARAGASSEAAAEATEPRIVVAIDEASPLVLEDEGAAIFDSEGKLVGPAAVAVALLRRLRAASPVTEALVQAIDAAGLLIEQPIRIRAEGRQDREVTGIRVLNERALNALSSDAFAALRRAGALPLVYAALLSWANFRQGPIGKSHPLSQNAAGQARGDSVQF